MSLIRKHVAVLQAWACLALVAVGDDKKKRKERKGKERYTRNILDCDQSNVLLAHYFQFSAKFLKFCRRIWLTSFNNSALKTFARRKCLGYISESSRVITNFGSKFVAVATRVGRGRIWLTSLNNPTPKTPWWMHESWTYLTYKPSYSKFWLKFRCHGNQGRPR